MTSFEAFALESEKCRISLYVINGNYLTLCNTKRAFPFHAYLPR